jgi:hypothetical protein
MHRSSALDLLPDDEPDSEGATDQSSQWGNGRSDGSTWASVFVSDTGDVNFDFGHVETVGRFKMDSEFRVQSSAFVYMLGVIPSRISWNSSRVQLTVASEDIQGGGPGRASQCVLQAWRVNRVDTGDQGLASQHAAQDGRGDTPVMARTKPRHPTCQ